MKRSTASWTTAIAASALLAMPVGSWAQQTSPAPSQTPSSSRPAGAQDPASDHLRKAESALNDIPAASLTGNAKSRVSELKKHISNLQRSASSAGKSAGPENKTGTELAAADRILTELLGEGATGASEPGAAGTSGKPTAKMAPALDDAAKAKLEEVRTHLTAFAASTGGSAPSGAADPSASASAAAAAAAASPSTSPSPATTPTPSEPSPAAPTPPAQDPAAQQPPAQQPPAQASAAQQPPAAAQSVDTDAVKRHLTAARESLSQLTQLPAAAQLTGDARTQVSQLISNFNELISTNTDWHASYTKVQANLNTLVGEQRADESPTPAPAAAGAAGAAGTTAIDPTIRAKLVEFRTHLAEFEKAAGGASASASPAASPATPADPTAAAAAAQPSPTSPSTPPATTPSTPAAPPSEPAAPTTPAEPSPTGTSGRTPPAAAGTTGTTAPSAATTPTASADSPAAQSDAMRHIEAIEAILNGSGTAGTTGANASKPTAGASSLDREQIEKIREHLAALRRALNQSGK